jgi:hypothetical protein
MTCPIHRGHPLSSLTTRVSPQDARIHMTAKYSESHTVSKSAGVNLSFQTVQASVQTQKVIAGAVGREGTALVSHASALWQTIHTNQFDPLANADITSTESYCNKCDPEFWDRKLDKVAAKVHQPSEGLVSGLQRLLGS